MVGFLVAGGEYVSYFCVHPHDVNALSQTDRVCVFIKVGPSAPQPPQLEGCSVAWEFGTAKIHKERAFVGAFDVAFKIEWNSHRKFDRGTNEANVASMLNMTQNAHYVISPCLVLFRAFGRVGRQFFYKDFVASKIFRIFLGILFVTVGKHSIRNYCSPTSVVVPLRLGN